MSNLFFVLTLLSIVGFCLGLIRPSIFKLKSRKKASQVFGIAFGISFILFGITTPSDNKLPATVPENSVASAQTTPTPKVVPAAQQNITEQDKIKQSVTAVLAGETNNGKEKLKSVEVDPDPASEKTASPTYSVTVSFNADDNLTNNLTRKGIESEMSDIYQVIYSNYKDVSSTQVAAYLDVVDQYGNTENSVVYTTILDQDVGYKINWSLDSATLEFEIVPKLWTPVLEMAFLRQ